jgi:hypothetical protein
MQDHRHGRVEEEQGMNQNQIEVTLKMPAPFYRVLEAAARAERMSLPKMMMRDLVVNADSYLAEYPKLREKFGIEKRAREWSYQPRLRKLAGLQA